MHGYLRKWMRWSRSAEIQSERAIARKNVHKSGRGGAGTRRKR